VCVEWAIYNMCVPNHTNNESIYRQHMVAGATCKKPQIESVSLYHSCDLWELSCIVVVANLVHTKMHEDLMTEKHARQLSLAASCPLLCSLLKSCRVCDVN
jgi:hypothetical protein